MNYTEKDILVWLNSIGVNNKNIYRLKQSFENIVDILDMNKENILNKVKIDKRQLNRILINKKTIASDLKEYYEKIRNKNIQIITISDNLYPKELLNIYDAPMVLYYKGNIEKSDKIAIGIVGSRKATAYGKWACKKFVKELSKLDVTIISGLAKGIDRVAHETAILNNTRTLAILGNGIDKIYPKSNYKLYKEIPQNGAIITEFPFGTEPFHYNFPQRNRIISGLSLGIIVIEAEVKSGSLITAHHGLEIGKSVFALPGNINSIYSKGTNKLIKDGAIPLLDIEDILVEIKEIQENKKNKISDNVDYRKLSELEVKIVNILKEGPLHSDLISNKLGIDIQTTTSILTILEIKEIVVETGSRIFTIC